MPLDHAFVGSVAVVYAAFGTSLNLVATGHVYPLWGESWAIEYIVLFIFFLFVCIFICFSSAFLLAFIKYMRSFCIYQQIKMAECIFHFNQKIFLVIFIIIIHFMFAFGWLRVLKESCSNK